MIIHSKNMDLKCIVVSTYAIDSSIADNSASSSFGRAGRSGCGEAGQDHSQQPSSAEVHGCVCPRALAYFDKPGFKSATSMGFGGFEI